MYVHRSLESRDLEAICTFPQCEEELNYISPKFVYPLTPDQILNLLKDRSAPTVIIAKATDQIVGYANLYGYDSAEETCWLGNVIVSTPYRGQGAAQYLLNTMLDKAKNDFKVKKIQLACHNTNSRGLAFYSKYGFKPYDIQISSLGDRKLITVQMSKELEHDALRSAYNAGLLDAGRHSCNRETCL